jgi:hypothetical protein
MNTYLGRAFIGALAFTASLNCAKADYPSTVTGLGPVLYYRLSETTPINSNIASNSGTAGAIGNGYYVGDPGTAAVSPAYAMHPTNGVLLGGTGDSAAFFNPGYVQTPMDPSINPQGAFTAEVWVQPAVAAASLNCLMSYGHIQNPASAPNRSGWLLYCDNGSAAAGAGFNFRMYNHQGINRSLTLAGGNIPNAGDWVHVAVAYDGTNGYLYVNGQLIQSGASPGYVANVDGNFGIGARNDLAFPFEGGIIDEVALYTNALSASVILSHYNNGTNLAPSQSYSSLVQASHPLLYYRLDEPAYTPSVSPPATANTGSAGLNQNALIGDNVIMGRAGVPYTGFGGGNNAAWFNGLNTVVSSMTNTPLTLNTSNVTFTAWVRPEGPTDGDGQGIGASGNAGIIYQRGAASTATGMAFGSVNNELRANWNDNATVYNFNPGLSFPDRTWSMAALVFNGTSVVYFLNGNAVTQTVANTAHDFSPTPIYLGWDNANSSRYMQGTLDEVAIFPSALTTSQLQSLYNAGTPPPVITVQPVAPTGTIYEGFSVTLSGAAIGGQPLAYRWIKGGNFISGQTTSSISFPNAHASDTGLYGLVASNQFGSATSTIVSLTVVAGPPILTKVPTPANIYPNGSAVFTAGAVGSTPITYQWMFSSGGTTQAIAGATSTSLTVNPVVAASAGNYFVVATNPNGYSNSPNAALTVLPVSPNYVAAVLTRSPVAYWRLNETSGSTAFDSQGGHNGTYNPVTTHNSGTGPRPSTFNGLESGNDSYTFDGNTSDLVAPPLNMNSYGTIVCFINPSATIPNDLFGIVFERGSGSDVSGLNYFGTSGGHLGYTWNGDPASYAWDSGLIPTPGTWNFVAVSVGPTNTTMYLDTGTGLQTAVNITNATPGLWAANTHLGTDPLGNRIYGGGLDEVAVFNSTLSTADIQAIHDAAFSGAFTPQPPTVLVSPSSNPNMLVGDSTTLTAVPAGTPPLNYFWLKNSSVVAGATHTSLPLNNVATGDSANYRFVVSNGSLSATSSPANIVVNPLAQSANLTNALLVHLKFEGTFLDSTANAHDAMTFGTAPTFIAGKLGQGIHINTTPGTGYLQLIDNGGDLQNAFSDATNFSFSMWFRYTSRFNDVPMMGNAVNSTYQEGWVVTDEGGKFEVSLADAASINTSAFVQDPVPNSPIVGDGNWHNAVVVIDHGAGLASCYIDGAAPFTWGINNLTTLNYGHPVTIGQDPTGSYGNAVFDLDDIGIWNTVLAPLDARSIYYAGLAGNTFDTIPPTITFSVSGGLLTLHWPNGTLQGSGQPNSGYTNVTGASAPSYSTPVAPSGRAYYRVVVQ